MTHSVRPTFSAAETAVDATGALPEWNLSDLYPAMDSPELTRDVARARADAEAFQERWRGRLEEAARAEDGNLAAAVASFEALEELLGRIISYAGLVYSGDT